MRDSNHRYNRQIVLGDVGVSGQEKMASARVLVVGAGGLGCPVIQYIAGAGIGTIGIMDFDRVDVSNLHRQVLFTMSDCGKFKAEIATKRVKEINPGIRCIDIHEKLTPENAVELFWRYDIIVDATDNHATRYVISDAAEITRKPVVYGSIYKYEGQVSVFNYQGGPGYRCLFDHAPEQSVNCNEAGVLGPLCGMIGSYMAGEVLTLAMEKQSPLNGKVMVVNSKTLESMMIRFERKSPRKVTMETPQEYYGAGFCKYDEPAQREISPEEFKKLVNSRTLLIDVRETWEQPKLSAGNVRNIPLDQLESYIGQIPKHEDVVVFCQSGGRSRIACHLLRHLHGFSNLINLRGGVGTDE